MRTVALLGFLACLASPVLAGKNANGALIVHTADEFHYTSNVCDIWELQDPGACESANTQVNRDDATPGLIWLIAAFCEESNPGLTAIYFGLRHNLPPHQGYFQNYGNCAPAGTLELPDAGWPDVGGNTVAFPFPIVGDRFSTS
jgi:hypothetical protein